MKLDQILEAVQQDDQNWWVNLFSTVLLSLATVISAWCVYQSSQWGGEQYFRIEDQNVADRDRLKYELIVIQRKAIDLSYFLEYISAKTADKHSDNYVFISLVLSTVLFFSGLCGLTESHTKQKILIGVASTIFAIALFILTRMPVMF